MSEESKLARSMGRGALARLVMSAIGCVGPVLVLGWLLGTSFLAALIDDNLAQMVFFCQLFALPPLGIALGIGGGLFLRRWLLGPFRRALDPLGPSSRYLLSGVKWTIPRGGDLAPAQVRLAGRTFVFFLPGSPSVDLRGGRDNALARMVRGEAWTSEELGGGAFVASRDGAALAAHLEDPEVREAWRRLLSDDLRSLRGVHLDPARGVSLTLRHVPDSELTEERARAWLGDLERILAAGGAD